MREDGITEIDYMGFDIWSGLNLNGGCYQL